MVGWVVNRFKELKDCGCSVGVACPGDLAWCVDVEVGCEHGQIGVLSQIWESHIGKLLPIIEFEKSVMDQPQFPTANL